MFNAQLEGNILVLDWLNSYKHGIYLYSTPIVSLFSCRYVLDGWPMTKSQVDLLSAYHIIPVCVVELEVSNEEMLKRAELDRQTENR